MDQDISRDEDQERYHGRAERMDTFVRGEAEIKALKRDIETARGLIRGALASYKKKKLRARSKKQVDSPDELFKEIEEIPDERSLMDLWGYGCITEAQFDRYRDLIELREQCEKNNGIYTDRVVELLEVAIRRVDMQYVEQLAAFEDLERQIRQDNKDTQRECEDWWRRQMGGMNQSF